MYVSALDEKKVIRSKWFDISDTMLTQLIAAAHKCDGLSDESLRKWTTSITHQEIQYGVLNYRPDDIPFQTICIFRDIVDFMNKDVTILAKSNNQVKRFIDLTSKNEVDIHAQSQIKSIRNTLKEKNVFCKLYSVDWAKEGIDEKIHKKYIVDMGKTFHEGMISRIKAAIDSSPVFDEATQEVAMQNSFCLKKIESFHGRSHLVKRGLEFLHDNRDNNMFVVYGISGAGKTSLMAKIAHSAMEELKNTGFDPVLAIRFCGTSPLSSNARNLMLSLTQQICRAYNEDDESWMHVPTDYKGLIENLQVQMSKATSQKPLIICIDSLDQLTDEDQARSQIVWLPMKTPQHVYLVVSTLPYVGGCLQYLHSQSIPANHFLEVEPISADDCENIFQGWLTSSKRTLTKEQWAEVISLATDASNESPTALRLKLIFDIACKCTSFENMSNLPNTVRHLINRFLQNLEDNHGKSLVSHMFGVLAVSRHGLSEDDLVDLLSGDDEVLDEVLQYHQPPVRRIPQIVFARLRNAIGDYMVERGAGGKSVLSWYHRQFWEAAEARYLIKESKVNFMQKYAALLADFFSDEVSKQYPDRNIKPQPLYWKSEDLKSFQFNFSRLSEVPHAASIANNWNQVLDSLCNLSFIAAKCKAGLGRDLLEEYPQALAPNTSGDKQMSMSSIIANIEKLKAFHKFVSSQIHVIEKHPELVYQQAMNMPDDNLVHKSVCELLKTNNQDLTPWLSGKLYLCVQKNKGVGDDPCLITLDGHSKRVSDVLTVGNYIISSGYDSKVMISSQFTGQACATIHSKAAVHRLCLLSYDEENGEIQIVMSSLDGFISIWVIDIGENMVTSCKSTWPAHTLPFDLIPMALSNKGDRLCTGFSKVQSGEVKVWDVKSCLDDESPLPLLQKITHKMVNSSSYGVWSLAWSVDDNFLVVGLGAETNCSYGGVHSCLVVCNSHTLETLWVRKDQCGFVSWLQVFEPEKQIFGDANKLWYVMMTLGSSVSLVAIYSTGNTKAVGRSLWQQFFNDTPIKALFSKDQGQLIMGQKNMVELYSYDEPYNQLGNPKEWDPMFTLPYNWNREGPLSKIGVLTGHGSTVLNVCPFYSDDRPMCVSGSFDGIVKIWDLEMFAKFKPASKHYFRVLCCGITPDHSLLFSGTGRGDNTFGDIKAWNPQTGELLSSTGGTYVRPLNSMAVSPRGDYITVRNDGYNEGNFQPMLDITRFKEGSVDQLISSKPESSISMPGMPNGGNVDGNDLMSFSPDGKYLLTKSSDNLMYILDMDTKSVEYLSVSKGALGGRFSPDGDQILYWDEKSVTLITFSDKETICEKMFKTFDGNLTTFAFDPQNEYIVSATVEGRIVFHERNSLEQKSVHSAHQQCITCIRCIPKVNKMVTSSEDKWVKLWSVPDMTQIASFYAGAEPTCVEGFVGDNDNIYVNCGDTMGRVISLEIKDLQ